MTPTTAFRAQADEYTGPPRGWFLGEEWFARDLEAVFLPRWLVAGHVDELDVHGKHGYLTYALGNSEVLIRRDEGGGLRAYHNVCPHRGAILCEGRSGTAPSKRIVCPYHQWTFSVSDGRLINSRQMHADFDPTPWHLQQVHVDVWNGVIFVCFADQPPAPLAEFLAEIDCGGYDLGAMKLAATKSHEIRANWKIVVDNNQECYHCAISHPELSERVDWRFLGDDSFDVDTFDAARAAGQEIVNFRLPTPSLTIGGERVCDIPAPRLDGGPLAAEAVAFHWEPGIAVNISRDYMWWFVPRPLSPDRTELRQYWFVARDAVEGRHYDVERLKSFFDTTMLQDRPLCESVQRGMNNPAFRPGPYNRLHQTLNTGFFRWYEEQIMRRFPDAAADG